MSRITQAIVRRERPLAILVFLVVAAGVVVRAGWVQHVPGAARSSPGPAETALPVPSVPDFSFVITAHAAEFQPRSPVAIHLTPTNVRAARGPSPLAISVTWSAPADVAARTITRYVVQVYDVGGRVPQYEARATATCPSCSLLVFPVAPPGHSYAFAVWPDAASGYGQPALSNVYHTPDLPGRPQAVAARSGAAAGSIVVTWSPPASDGGTPVDGYTAQLFDVTGSPAYSTSETTHCRACTSVTFAAATSGRRYEVAVYAHSGAGFGDPAGSNPTTPASTPATTATPHG